MAKKAKKPKKKTFAPELLKRARGVAAGLEASYAEPPPPAAMAPAPLLDEIAEMGDAGIAGMIEHLGATSAEGRIPTLRAFRELRNKSAVPGLLDLAGSLRWSPEELFAIRDTIHELDPDTVIPPELDGDAIARARKAAELLGESLSPESAGEATGILESLPPRLQEMAFREAFAGAGAEAEKMLQLAAAWAGRGAAPPPGLIEALTSQATPEAAQALSKMAEAAPDKETGSRIRKALFRLKKKGIVVEKAPEPEKREPEASGQRLDYVKAVVSATDGTGTFLLWVARSRQPRGRSLFQARVRHGRGIEEFIATDVSAKELRDFFGRLAQESKLSTTEVAPGYAFWLLQQAQKENEGGGAPLPSGFTHSKLLLAPLADPDAFPLGGAHPVRGIVQPLGEGDQRVEVREMFAHPAFWTWVLEEERIVPYFNKAVESFQSQVAVDDNQRRQLFDNSVEESAKEMYEDADLRQRLSRQLETNAYVLNRIEQNNMAREAITLADELASGGDQPEFFTEIVRYSIGVLLDRAIRQSQEAQGQAHDHAHDHDHEHHHDHDHGHDEHGEGGQGESSVIVTP